MLQFQDSQIYEAALSLNGMVRDLDEDALQYDNGHAFETLRERAVSMLLDLAHAANEGEVDRLETLGEVRSSAFMCAALLDICRHRTAIGVARWDEAHKLLERIVELIDLAPRATSRRKGR
jgi:hypothetical protein